MDDAQLKKLVVSRQSRLESNRATFETQWQDVADYVCPIREDIYGSLLPGTKKGSKIFDGTAVGAAILATDGIHGYHVSPAFPWFKYSMNRQQVNKVPSVRQWLEEVEYCVYMALNRSNFYSEMWSYIYDGFTIGTADMTCEEDLSQDRIVFECVHPGEVYLAENKYGEVDVIHRKRKLTARQIVQMFDGDGKVPAEIRQTNENSPFTEYEVIHAIFPREDYDDRKKDAKSKKYASVWYLKAHDTIARVSGYDTIRHIPWRYQKSGKEVYGYSPAMLAMADIKGLNLMNKTILGAAQLAVDPAYNIPVYLEGKVQLAPRGFNYVKDQDRITPVNTAGNFPIAIDREQAKQQSIRERFHVDTFLMLSQMSGKGQRTAYEVSEMMAEKAAVLGAELGPLNSALDRMLDAVYEIEANSGRLPAPPDELLQISAYDDSLRFDPVYMGPLAQAQREKFGKSGILKFLVDVAPMVQVNPDILDNYDLDEASRILADMDNLPFSVIRSAEERDRIRTAKMQAMQQEQQKEDMERLAGGIKQVASADRDTGNQLLSGLTGAQNAPA